MAMNKALIVVAVLFAVLAINVAVAKRGGVKTSTLGKPATMTNEEKMKYQVMHVDIKQLEGQMRKNRCPLVKWKPDPTMAFTPLMAAMDIRMNQLMADLDQCLGITTPEPTTTEPTTTEPATTEPATTEPATTGCSSFTAC